MKLTAVSLGTLPPGDHKHDSVEGLVLRVRQSGARSWSLRYSFQGQDRRLTLGRVKLKDTDKGLTLAEAKDAAKEALARIVRGEDPQRQKRPSGKPTVSDLGREALEHLTLRPKSKREFERLLTKEIRPALGDLFAAELTRRQIREWGEKIAKRAPIVANRAHGWLCRMYSLAVERDLLETTPFHGLKKPAREQASERVLSSVELWALMDTLRSSRSTSSAVVRLLLLTGVRRNMVLGARAEEFEGLDGLDPRWIIPGGMGGRSKSKRAHVVPLSSQAVKLVKQLLQRGTVHLFPAGRFQRKQAVSLTKTWRSSYVRFLRKMVNRRLSEPAPRWTIHNLRHSLASHMREDLGIRADVVSLILGHAVAEGAAVTRVYDRAQLLKERRAALQEWATWLDQLQPPGKKMLKWREG